jgi:hypothetical protein
MPFGPPPILICLACSIKSSTAARSVAGGFAGVFAAAEFGAGAEAGALVGVRAMFSAERIPDAAA